MYKCESLAEQLAQSQLLQFANVSVRKNDIRLKIRYYKSTLRNLKLLALISGGGTTLANLLTRINEPLYSQSRLNASIEAVISSRARVKGNQIALDNNLPLHIVERSKFGPSFDLLANGSFSHKLAEIVSKIEFDLAVLAGFMCLINPLPKPFVGKTINIHPALLPSFGGKGMYGIHVHKAVLNSGTKVTGCTVHFVNDEYDCGPIIAQKVVPVLAHDTPESLQERVQAAERELLPTVINWFALDRITIDGKKVVIAPRSRLQDTKDTEPSIYE